MTALGHDIVLLGRDARKGQSANRIPAAMNVSLGDPRPVFRSRMFRIDGDVDAACVGSVSA